MTHFGILCPSGHGHLNPMTTLGNELLRRGHRVTVFNFLDAKDKVMSAGLEFQPIGEEMFPVGSIAEGLAKLGKFNGIAAFQYTINTHSYRGTKRY